MTDISLSYESDVITRSVFQTSTEAEEPAGQIHTPIV